MLLQLLDVVGAGRLEARRGVARAPTLLPSEHSCSPARQVLTGASRLEGDGRSKREVWWWWYLGLGVCPRGRGSESKREDFHTLLKQRPVCLSLCTCNRAQTTEILFWCLFSFRSPSSLPALAYLESCVFVCETVYSWKSVFCWEVNGSR